MINIENLRLGFATNSSSTHSIIIAKEMEGISNREIEEGEFGWGFFTAASKDSKTLYAATILQYALSHLLKRNSLIVPVVKDWTGVEVGEGSYIDHQSNFGLPNEFGSDIPSKDYFDELLAFLQRENVVILGGNDNDEEEHELLGAGEEVEIPYVDGQWVCRKDETYGFWTLFNRQDGTKIRFRFGSKEEIEENPIVKSSTPELVDLKITDFCTENCPWCYQDSKERGKHGDLQNIHSILMGLSKLHVFEVAIGGGEVTLYPHFTDVMTTCKRYGIVPNFTTRRLDWLYDDIKRPIIIEACGGFAYSARNPQEVSKLASLLEVYGIPKNKASIQIVMGTMDKYMFESVLREADRSHIRVTLLGYKTIGRGNDYKPKDYDWWYDVIAKLHKEGDCPNLGIDTSLADSYKAKLDEAGVPDWLYTIKEGAFSCYIDATTMEIAPSSYCEERYPLNETGFSYAKIIKNKFQTF